MNIVFVSNSARCGGGLYSELGAPELVNSVFNGNNAFSGGAICNDGSSPTIINSTIVDNYADRGAAIFNRNSSPRIVNSILARNAQRGQFLECQRAGFPCTFADMDPAVIVQSTSLSDEVRDLMEAESVGAAVAWLRTQPDVVFALGDTYSIAFRLKGGPNTWVLTETALGDDVPAGKARQLDQAAFGLSPASNLTFADVVGDDTNGDGKRNNRDKKKALLLSPFKFDFDPSDEGAELNTLFESVEAYQGGTTFYPNSQAGYDKFATWDDYDVVHVAAHGARLCSNSYCLNTIGTGTEVFAPELNQSTEPGFAIMNIGPAVPNTSPDQWFISLDRDFFAQKYPQGLDRTVVMLSACETGDRGNDPNSEDAPDLASLMIVGGLYDQASTPRNSVYLGWTEVVLSSLAFNTSIKFYEDMANNGWPTLIAEREVKAQGLGSGPNGEGQIAELRRWSRSGNDLYIRDMVSMIDGDGMKLVDGGDITPYFDGIVSDSQPDDLKIGVLVEGIDVGTESDYKISFELDGQSLGAPVPLPDVDQYTKVADYTYFLEDKVAAGKDLRPNDTYTLEAIIDMPGGGQSRWEATNLSVDGCYWNLTLSGARAGTYDGEFVSYSDPGGGMTINMSSSEPDPVVFILLGVSPPPGPSGPYVLGLNDVGQGSGVVNFISMDLNPPFQLTTGDASDLKDQDGNVIFSLPGPSTFSITKYGDNKIAGRATGQVFGWVNSDPINPIYESAAWSIEFSGENQFNPDGSPRNDTCGG